jgi:SAM-dependent methyltransferase
MSASLESADPPPDAMPGDDPSSGAADGQGSSKLPSVVAEGPPMPPMEVGGVGGSPHPHLEARRQLAWELTGRGIEFGPGCHPLAMGPLVERIEYVDAHDRETFARLFPEAADDIADFPAEIHHRFDADADWFVDPLGRGSRDFVVANHILEHLVNPLRFLEQCWLLLAPGGLLFLGLPDKRRIFDRFRPRTRLDDLVDRFRRGETRVSDERILEFINRTEFPQPPLTADDPAARDRLEVTRQRSIHVNCWVLDDVVELFDWFGREHNMPLELHDGLIGGDESVLLLRKTEHVRALDRWPMIIQRLWAEYHERQRREERRHRDACHVRLEHRLDHVYAELAHMRHRTDVLVRVSDKLRRTLRRIPGGGLLNRWLDRARQAGD